MPLFQNTVVSKYLKSLDKVKTESKWELFKAYFHNSEIQENIRNSKEEQFQEGFLRELFVKILGYTLNPQPDFNLNTEYKNVKDSKKADGAIIVNGDVKAVIELKGTNTTDLSKVEAQAFGYKNNQPKCTYVITSNFEKVRFYIDNAIENIEFNLFTLSKEDFEIMYLCLAFENIKKEIPSKIKKDSISEEDVITKILYKDYSQFKKELYQNLVELNPQFDKLTLFKQSQTLLDRFLFLFFAEDRQLLPPNSVRLVLSQWKKLQDLDAYTPLFDRFKKYFGYLNTGYKGKNYDVYAYNGGLFKPNEILDSVVIDDDLLYKHTLKLSEYDFDSEVDVNILGHIFENSLNEIDEVKAELEGKEVDKGNTKRKKDGVFYTPKYITKYIVENTVGKLCDEKKAELEIIEDDYATDKKRQKKTIKNLLDKLTNYREWLIQLTICDPACGSGAFLNQALDYLILEHGYIDELQAKLFGDAMVLSDVEKSILENNLFGVDLNEESVEIAKLSLWLRTAVPNRKLNDLSNNIKCGNSLIDDPEIAGDKAFNWEKEFPHIFEKGGFDVVIGNPPYGAKLSKNHLNHLVKTYKDFGVSSSLSDTYVVFYVKSLKDILCQNGILGFITPNSWRLILSGGEFRDFLSKTDFIFQEIIQHQEKVFADATVDCDTLLIRSLRNNNHSISIKIKEYSNILLSHNIQQDELASKDFFNLYLIKEAYDLKYKIESNSVFVKDELIIKNGVKPYEKGKGRPPQSSIIMKEKPFTSEFKIDESFSPLIGGSSFHRYKVLWKDDFWIKYGEWLAAPRDIEIFSAPEKLIFRQTGDSIIGTLIDDKFIMRDNTHIVLPKSDKYDLKYVLALLCSSLSNFIYWTNNPEKGEAMAQIKLFHIGLLCFKCISKNDQQPFIEKAGQMLLFNKDLNDHSQKFQRTLQREFPEIDKLSKKLESWYELSYGDFLKELKKKKVDLSLGQKAEWEDYFLAEQEKALALQSEIDKTDKEIDQMVYELYDLTEEEVAIVEGG